YSQARLRTSASLSPTKPKSGARSSGRPTSSRSEAGWLRPHFITSRYWTPISTNLAYRRPHRRIPRNAARQPHCEHRTLARLARPRDFAPHHLAHLSADHQAEPRTAVLARRLRGRLRELLEQPAHLLGRHTDAGVGDRERDPIAAVLLSLVSSDGDSALFGE